MSQIHEMSPPKSEPEPRIRYTLHRLPTSPLPLLNQHRRTLSGLSSLATTIERDGAAPILPDGRGVGGNVALFLPNETEPALIVSKSGKTPGRRLGIEDFVVVRKVDWENWEVWYESVGEDVVPTSDTPMYWAAMVLARLRCKEDRCTCEGDCTNDDHRPRRPLVALHGHLLPTDRVIRSLHIPIATTETLCSTRADAESVQDLVEEGWPKHNVFVRKGHGFFVLGESVGEVERIYGGVVRRFFGLVGGEGSRL